MPYPSIAQGCHSLPQQQGSLCPHLPNGTSHIESLSFLQALVCSFPYLTKDEQSYDDPFLSIPWTYPSLEHDAKPMAIGSTHSARTASVCPVRVLMHLSFFHIFMDRSADPVRKFPFGRTRTVHTAPWCPRSLYFGILNWSQIIAVLSTKIGKRHQYLSQEPDMSVSPSTTSEEMLSEWPKSILNGSASTDWCGSKAKIILSEPPLKIIPVIKHTPPSPFGNSSHGPLNASALTKFE